MEKYFGRHVVNKLKFTEKGTFKAYYAALWWLKNNGYQYGSTDIPNPMGFKKPEWDMPQKWHNLTTEQKNSVDGIMTGNIREGEVVLIFFEKNK